MTKYRRLLKSYNEITLKLDRARLARSGNIRPLELTQKNLMTRLIQVETGQKGLAA